MLIPQPVKAMGDHIAGVGKMVREGWLRILAKGGYNAPLE
jgi:hypothetical protein